MSSGRDEKVIGHTWFGTVTYRRIRRQVGNVDRGSEDIPLRHITAVRLGTQRFPFFGLIPFVAGAVMVIGGFQGNLILVPIGIFVAALGAYLIVGWPRIQIETTGSNDRYLAGPPWKRADAKELVRLVRLQIYANRNEDPSERWGV